MKFIVFVCLLAVALARPDKDARTLLDERDHQADGSYSFNFETDNGISRFEQGSPVAEGAIAKTGEITFTLPNGEEFVLLFTADEDGFRVEPGSSHIPTIPTRK